MLQPTTNTTAINTTATDKKLTQVISASSRKSVADVISVMQALDALLPNGDGLKWFNLMYLRTTEAVKVGPSSGGWENQQFLERLTVVFAQLYFNAVVAWEKDPNSVSRSWSPLFISRYKKGVARIQFAIAGMNAHINHDLAQALVQTCQEYKLTPRRGRKEHRDYEKVNTILETVSTTVKVFIATGIIGLADQELGQLDDNIALWSIRKARETAFTNAEILWRLRLFPSFNSEFIRNLDRLVGLSSRGLLIPCQVIV